MTTAGCAAAQAIVRIPSARAPQACRFVIWMNSARSSEECQADGATARRASLICCLPDVGQAIVFCGLPGLLQTQTTKGDRLRHASRCAIVVSTLHESSL